MKDIMIDVETLGTAPGSVVTQIGAVYFDRDTGELGSEMLVNLNIDDCLNAGLVVDGGSLKFWFDQPRENASFTKNAVPLTKGLQTLRDFYDGKALVWSHATFDFPILHSAYRAIGQKLCFPYRNLRDIRTLVDLSNRPFTKDKDGDPKNHNGLDDCKYQVKYCVECFNILRAGRPV